METLFAILANVIYGVMGVLALWGIYCAITVWRRIDSIRFRSEDEQDEFMDELDVHLKKSDYSTALTLCEEDRRAMPQLALYAIENRELGYQLVRRRVLERFQQDVLADIENRMSWVATVTKSAPMIGLFGTVIGMMGAFNNLADGAPDPGAMAKDIMVALITTASGLAIAVPLVLIAASIAIRLRKMEDLIANGMAQLLDSLKSSYTK